MMIVRLRLGAIAVVVASMPLGCADDTGNARRADASDKVVRIALDEDSLWDNESLHDALRPDAYGWSTLAIDEATRVVIVDSDKELKVDCSLVSAVRYRLDSKDGYLRINSQPRTLEDAYRLALEICAFFEMSDSRLVSWHKARQYERRMSCSQIERTPRWEHTVEIRPSFNRDKPWFVSYEVSERSEDFREHQ